MIPHRQTIGQFAQLTFTTRSVPTPRLLNSWTQRRRGRRSVHQHRWWYSRRLSESGLPCGDLFTAGVNTGTEFEDHVSRHQRKLSVLDFITSHDFNKATTKNQTVWDRELKRLSLLEFNSAGVRTTHTTVLLLFFVLGCDLLNASTSPGVASWPAKQQTDKAQSSGQCCTSQVSNFSGGHKRCFPAHGHRQNWHTSKADTQ